MSLLDLRSTVDVGSKSFRACIMQQKPNCKQNNDPCFYLNINVILKTTDCGVISASEPRRWKTLNNYEFYRQLLSVHEWGHSQAWMGLCVTLVRSETSLKIWANSPMSLGLKIRHGDKQTWPRYEPVPQIPCRRTAWIGTVGRTTQRLEKAVCLSHAGALMCCTWLSPPHFFFS